MLNRFFAQAATGKTEPGSLIGANVLTWMVFFFLGAIPTFAIVGYYSMDDPEMLQRFMDNPSNAVKIGIPALALFVGTMLQFPLGLAALGLGTRYILKRSVLSVATGFSRFRWGRMAYGFGLWTVLLLAYMGLMYLKDPGLIQYQGDFGEWAVFLPVALLLVPVQCAFEEMAIRGQVLQSFSLGKTFRPLFGVVNTSLFFALLHSMNPEVDTYGWLPMMAQYFVIGAIWCCVALMEEGLEMSIGMHLGNNLFSFFILSYPGSVLQTPSIFVQTSMAPWQDFLALLAFGMVVFGVLTWGKREKWDLLLRK